MVKPYRTSVVLGRFQIFHNAHKKLLDEAFTQADHVIVVLGSHLAALDIRNPFTTAEREEMIRRVYPDADLDFVVVPDRYYNDKIWLGDVMSKVRETVEARCMITGEEYHPRAVCLCGYYKDSSSYYLDYFREVWSNETRVFKKGERLSATDIRKNYFSGSNVVGWQQQVPAEITNYLLEYQKHKPEQYQYFVDEYRFINAYKTKTQSKSDYPIQFVTVDAIVVQNGHVLLVTRKAAPGKGLWALPGGFVKPNESLENAVLRELKEETSIQINKSELRNRCLKEQHVFDHPDRDLRGRVFTHGFFFELEDNKPRPGVKGGDDAAKAFWKPWDEIIRYSDRVYSDHVHILTYFLSRF